jgi:pyruvate kinase
LTLRRTRIICTLGPASASRATIRALITAGMDVARLNFSHGSETEQRAAVATVRSVAASMGRHVALLQDLQGPKIRTGRFAQPPVRLRRGEPVTITSRPVVGDEDLIPVSHQALIRALEPDERILLADGEIELRVRSVRGTDALCTVMRGGLLGERKGVTAPGCEIRLPALTEKDLADLRVGAELGFDYLALSFVRSEDDLHACRKAMRGLGMNLPLIAKLERPQALQHLDGILAAAQGVMVARGDLGVELSLAEVPAAQKDIIERANLRGVPVITATEMLESMVTSNRPTRAEASDVANAIWDGTDAVMLSQETSVGAHPIESVRAMAAICRAAEEHPAYERARPVWTEPGSIGAAIAHSAAAVAAEVQAAAIVAFTETGSTALRVSKANPSVPILAASPHAETLRRTALYAGVVPMLVEHGADTDDLIAKAVEAAIRSRLVTRRDRIVVVAGVAARPGQTNLLKVVTVQ